MSLLQKRNMKSKLIIFDFDGTIADTSPGILDSHKFALARMGRIVPEESELLKVIGGQLLKTYIDVFKFDEQSAVEAVRIYRERYANVGINLANLYDGFEDLIIQLKNYGCNIGIATLKAERFAKEMLKKFNMLDKFDVVCGMDKCDSQTKTDLIEKCIEFCNVNKSQAILVGDSSNDLKGAEAAGIRFIGVTYGFGFKKNVEYNFITADSPREVYSAVQKINNKQKEDIYENGSVCSNQNEQRETSW
ncbi:HAD hydrolase-like protein [Mediterraneibacter glycyrrhizinilyticus]|uniref:HAD hydrolase-like protein n=1 Tax=Mediterraneibacter glycyrrhizinilyticus TaxID=342942 RepID=UPI0025A38E55|nr:HAD hydrolase-like protein [Mediterraneibacter glycyrrhizinilyticus]MDM8209875.1 HAD hydrolase-like protein [Mediterraneibacter glycyrrhizinilyticus]